MTHAQQVAETLGVSRDFCEHRESMRLLELAQSDAARRAVREWRNPVLPQLARVEKEWFQTPASKWSRHCFSLPWDARPQFLRFLQSLCLSKSQWAACADLDCPSDWVLPFCLFLAIPSSYLQLWKLARGAALQMWMCTMFCPNVKVCLLLAPHPCLRSLKTARGIFVYQAMRFTWRCRCDFLEATPFCVFIYFFRLVYQETNRDNPTI